MPKVKQFDEADVLGKAKKVFTEKGYNGTSMDDLVQATGLSRSSIYDTFGDKHGLFLKALQQYRCNSQSDLQQLLEKTDSPKEKIRLVFDATVKSILRDKERMGCMLLNVSMELSCSDKEVAAVASENMEEMEQLFAEWVKKGQARGEISRTFSSKALARHLYNGITGLRVVGRSRPEPDALRDVVKITLSILDK